jgi:cytochrome P450
MEISCIALFVMFSNTENTAALIENVIADLATNPSLWQQTKHETEQYLLRNNESEDLKGLICSPWLNACIMESARHNTNAFVVGRVPVDKK